MLYRLLCPVTKTHLLQGTHLPAQENVPTAILCGIILKNYTVSVLFVLKVCHKVDRMGTEGGWLFDMT